MLVEFYGDMKSKIEIFFKSLETQRKNSRASKEGLEKFVGTFI